MLGLQNEREWKLFCDMVLLQPALAADPRFDSSARRNEHRGELRELILSVFGTLTAAQVIARLDEARIANARMNTMAGVWEHSLQTRGKSLQQVQSPQGPIVPRCCRLVPTAALTTAWTDSGVGEHTDAILRALGRNDEQVAALRAKGAI